MIPIRYPDRYQVLKTASPPLIGSRGQQSARTELVCNESALLRLCLARSAGNILKGRLHCRSHLIGWFLADQSV